MVESSFLQVVTADCGLVLRWGDSARHTYARPTEQGNPWCGAFSGLGAFPAGPVSWAAAGGSGTVAASLSSVTHSQGAGEGGFLEAVTRRLDPDARVPLCNQGFGRL